jgi:hypothetical protein
MRSIISLIAISFCILLAGCSKQPSESDVKHEIESLMESRSNGALKLTMFKKLNGVGSVVNGVRMYRMDFEAVIARTRECYWSPVSFKAFDSVNGDPAALGLLHSTQGGAMIKSSILMEKTEQGWRSKN